MSQFVSEGEFIFLGAETRESAKGNPYTRVTLGDEVELQRLSFFKSDDCDVSNFHKGAKVKATITLITNGFNINTNLTKLELVK